VTRTPGIRCHCAVAWASLKCLNVAAKKRREKESGNWEPGEDVDAVFREAKEAAKARRYKEALAKHIWFHEHALERRPSLSGVRSSYALSAWVELSEQYPPALRALHRMRERAERRVRAGKDVWREFSDFKSINHYLKDTARTVRLFKWMASNDHEGAAQVYSLIEETLYLGGEFDLCGNFIEPAEFDKIRRGYRVNLKFAKDPTIGADHAQWAFRYFTDRARRMVHLLGLNDRTKEARSVARRAAQLFKNAEFASELKRLVSESTPRVRVSERRRK
jgi:hypothetical protein